MDPTRESEELVGLWQELQEAQVEGDAGRLAAIGARAEGQSRREGASGEWALLAREAGRNAERLHHEVVAQPSVGVGDDQEPIVLETASADAETAAETPRDGRRSGKKGSLIWLALVLGWALLQIVQGLGGEG